MATRLFHFSDRGDIHAFTPKPVDIPSEREPGNEWLNGPLVWAVDERRQATYLFPRDCPRILVWPTESTSPRDRERWWGDRTCSMIAHVEWTWFERIRRGKLYRYEFPPQSFRATSDDWMWVSREVVTPLNVEVIDNLLGCLQEQRVELRIMESLVPLRDVWQTTLHASGIRLRNAQDWSSAVGTSAHSTNEVR